MKNESFFHVHTHSFQSLLDGLSSPENLAKRASELGFKYLALTDHASVSGCIKFQKACDKYNIKSIHGIEFYIVPDLNIKEKGEKRGHILVLCKNEIGWQNINKMLTIANLQGFYRRPRIDYKTLLDHSEGLVFSTACVSSFLNQSGGIEFFEKLVKKHPKDIYLEVMPFSSSLQRETNELILKLKNKYSNCRLVASNDIHYLNKEDSLTHEILLMIQTKKTFNSVDRWSFGKEYDVYMKTADEMIQGFIQQDQLDRNEYISAIKNTIEIAKKCEGFRIEPKSISLPKIKSLGDSDENEYLKGLCIQGLVKKGFNNDKSYLERMEYEYGVISSKGYSRYFLLVWDLYQWARSSGITISHGRGSSGCSLIAYLLGITNLDPIKWELPFSRFINEERLDLPDFDTDWPDNKREEIINYLKETYGENRVVGISTFLVLKSRGAIRDVCRVYDIPLKEADEFAKAVPYDSNLSTELQNEEKSETIIKFQNKYPKVVEQILKIEGTVRGVGRHAAGIIVSDEDLHNGTRCNLENRDNNIVVNWEKEDAEHQGLVKVDILALSTLTIIAETLDLIKKNHDLDFDIESMPLNNPEILKMISDGNTTGIFQAGTIPMTLLIKEMGIEDFTHFVDAIALVRPGSKEAGETEKYIRRKHGESWEHKHPIYEEVAKRTYGTLPYQESVMNVIHKVAGLPYATADKIRKIIGKKRDASEFQQFKDMFVDGCKKQQTLSEDEANEFWDGLQHAARYLFNFSHSIFYAMLGMNTAWLKYYYPAEFLAASLSYGGDTHKQELISESKRLGLKILPPKIAISDPLKWKTKDNILYTPFNEIKGLGEKSLSKLESKSDGFFTPESSLIKGKMKKILDDIKAYDKDEPLPLTACSYFDIDICNDYKSKYPNLIKLYGDSFDDARIYDLLHGNVEIPNLEIEYDSSIDISEIVSCKACELHKECKHKVLPSLSNNRIMILGEAAYIDEHEKGYPFAGKSGKTLWNEFKRYNLKRDDFNVVNSVMCAVLKSKNPKQIHIDACKIHVEKYIQTIRPVIVLVLGNWSRYYITGELSGIMKANATIEWNESIGAFVAYCLHPSSVWRGIDNAKMFSEGIEFFSNKLDELGIF